MPSSRRTDLAALLRLAADQHGVVALPHAATFGLTSANLGDAVDRGLLRRPHPGVFVVEGAPNTWRQELLVATTALRGVASHRAAARLHRLDGVECAPLEVTTAHNGTRLVHDYVTHRTRRFDTLPTLIVDSIRVTTLARTLVDLGAVVDDDVVEQALDDALRRGTNLRWITATLHDAVRTGPTGVDALQRVLARPDRVGRIPDSHFERLVERIARSAGIPAPVRQHPVIVDGRLIARIDVAWPEHLIGLEADSEMWHSGPRRGRVARARHNRLTSWGWEMIYASWQDTEDPTELIGNLQRLFAEPR
ncbi:MAG: hypothetical protein M3Y51_03040 [Actinomycetota bacterium]|nr:hypothetical protein [Actinomycetota bacterium]